MNKFMSKNLSNIYCSPSTFINNQTEKEFTDNTNYIKCYVSKNKGFIKYINNTKILKSYNYWKLIIFN